MLVILIFCFQSILSILSYIGFACLFSSDFCQKARVGSISCCQGNKHMQKAIIMAQVCLYVAVLTPGADPALRSDPHDIRFLKPSISRYSLKVDMLSIGSPTDVLGISRIQIYFL